MLLEAFLWGFEAYHVLVWMKNHQELQSQYHRGPTTRDVIIILTNDGRVQGATCLMKLCLGVSFMGMEQHSEYLR